MRKLTNTRTGKIKELLLFFLFSSSWTNIINTCLDLNITVQLKAAWSDVGLRTSSNRHSFHSVWSHTGLRAFAILQLSHAEARLRRYQQGQCGTEQTFSPALAFVWLFISTEKLGGVESYQWDPSGCISFPLPASVLVWMQNINQPNQLHPFVYPSALSLNDLCASPPRFRGQLKDDTLLTEWQLTEWLSRAWIQSRQQFKNSKIYRKSWAYILQDTH